MAYQIENVPLFELIEAAKMLLILRGGQFWIGPDQGRKLVFHEFDRFPDLWVLVNLFVRRIGTWICLSHQEAQCRKRKNG